MNDQERRFLQDEAELTITAILNSTTKELKGFQDDVTRCLAREDQLLTTLCTICLACPEFVTDVIRPAVQKYQTAGVAGNDSAGLLGLVLELGMIQVTKQAHARVEERL